MKIDVKKDSFFLIFCNCLTFEPKQKKRNSIPHPIPFNIHLTKRKLLDFLSFDFIFINYLFMKESTKETISHLNVPFQNCFHIFQFRKKILHSIPSFSPISIFNEIELITKLTFCFLKGLCVRKYLCDSLLHNKMLFFSANSQ